MQVIKGSKCNRHPLLAFGMVPCPCKSVSVRYWRQIIKMLLLKFSFDFAGEVFRHQRVAHRGQVTRQYFGPSPIQFSLRPSAVYVKYMRKLIYYSVLPIYVKIYVWHNLFLMSFILDPILFMLPIGEWHAAGCSSKDCTEIHSGVIDVKYTYMYQIWLICS